MKSISVKCPDCAARMIPDADNTRLVCAYCGHEAILESRAGAGFYQAERGKGAGKAQRTQGRMELAERLSAFLEPLGQLEELGAKGLEKKNELERLRARLAVMKTPGSRFKTLIIPGILALAMALLGSANEEAALGIAVGFMMGAAVLLPILLVRWVWMAVLRNRLKKAEQEMEAASLEARRLSFANDFGVVPEGYLNTEALTFSVQALKAGRANTLREALDLYEERGHRERMEGYQREQISLQRDLLKESRKRPAVIVKEDSGIGRELLKGAAWAAGSILVGGLLRRRRK